MKRTATIFILMCIGFTYSMAQKGIDKKTQEKINAARIGLITERLDLTSEQAEKFWPIYKEFLAQRSSLKAEYDQAKSRLDPKTATEEERKELLDLGLKLKERSAGLERTYSDRMLKVITTQQVIALRKAEEDFRRIIFEQIQQRRRIQQERRDRIRNRVDDRIQNRKNN